MSFDLQFVAGALGALLFIWLLSFLHARWQFIKDFAGLARKAEKVMAADLGVLEKKIGGMAGTVHSALAGLRAENRKLVNEARDDIWTAHANLVAEWKIGTERLAKLEAAVFGHPGAPSNVVPMPVAATAESMEAIRQAMNTLKPAKQP
jgi:hypothetical protein